MKCSSLLAGALALLPVAAQAEMTCGSSDGTQFIVNLALYPQTIEVNSDFLSLKSVKVGKDGIKRMTYRQDYGSASAILATKDGYKPVLIKSGKQYTCG